MKAALAVVAIALVLVALLPSAAGIRASAPSAAPAPTRINAVPPTGVVANVATYVSATLTDASTGQPVSGENLTFALRTTFGWLALGSGMTDPTGRAGISYTAVAGGTFAMNVSFAGDAGYMPSNTTLDLTVLAAGRAPPPAVPPDLAIVVVIVAVLGGVWSTYAFIGFLVLGIRSAALHPEEDEVESSERETMAEEPSDAEASPKRVPGRANANRAVVGLAVAALVLAGASVGLVVVGGLGHTAAYTPTTVSFQLAIVPDIQGAGWDAFVPNSLVVHAGDTVKITIINADTMPHGFYLPDFDVNVQIQPGTSNATTGEVTPWMTPTPITFVASQSGNFVFRCNVPCGDGHEYMTGVLEVLPD